MTETTKQETKPNPKLYKSHRGSCKYVFGILEKADGTLDKSVNGREAIFVVGPGGRQGRFATTNPTMIALLDKEIANNHPDIFVDSGEPELTAEAADPLAYLKARMRAEIIAEEQARMLAATDPTRDMGTSEQGKLNPQSTRDVASVAIGGSGQGIHAQLSSLLNKK